METYWDFYCDCSDSGELPNFGLCNTWIGDTPLFDLFTPNANCFSTLEKQTKSIVYWASGLRYDDLRRDTLFSPLRQTIVLFMAAMNNEL